jgi:inhibitor of KinA sporulation pathway (predicted exonuclease)
MIRVSLDLELNTDGLGETQEIIQIGYTVFDTKDGIIETSGDYVKTDIPLYPFITNLTGISQREIDTRGVSLIQAYQNLVEFCRKHDVKFWQLVTWGSGDHEELKQQVMLADMLGESNTEWNFGRSELNLKAVYQMYQAKTDSKRSGGLGLSMRKQGLSFVPYLDKVSETAIRQRGQHDARADALNTALFYLHLQGKMV